jgi:hypothetical protein
LTDPLPEQPPPQPVLPDLPRPRTLLIVDSTMLPWKLPIASLIEGFIEEDVPLLVLEKGVTTETDARIRIEKFKPQLAIACPPYHPQITLPESSEHAVVAFQWLREKGTALVGWFLDDPYDILRGKEFAKSVDLVVTHCRSSLKVYQEDGHKAEVVVTAPPSSCVPTSGGNRVCDILFMGDVNRLNRALVLRELSERAAAHNWKFHALTLQDPWVDHDRWAAIFAGTKIHLILYRTNPHEKTVTLDNIDPRILASIAAGGFPLFVDTLPAFVKEAFPRITLPFTPIDELIANCNYWITRQDEREEMRIILSNVARRYTPSNMARKFLHAYASLR